MGYIIKRRDAELVKKEKHWILLYGRRKVGKTFLLRELCKFKNYYVIKKDLSVISNKGTIQINEMVEEVKKLLSDNKEVVIDEFQRLDESVFEEISLLHPKGKLILSGSSLRIIKKFFEPKYPFLGFFTPVKMEFIRPLDILLNLDKKFNEEILIELSTFLREPWAIPNYNSEKTLDFVYGLIVKSKQIITGLIGEIFTEEERELTRKYEAILNLIGGGIWNTKELTSILYSRKLIPDPSPNHLIQYLKNLEEMELVESVKLYKTKGRYYRLISPLMNLYYYLDSRYDISNRNISLEEVKPTLQKLINLEIQNFIADLFAEIYNGRKEYFVSPDKEVDFIITKRNNIEVIGEVKWKIIDSGDIAKFKRNSERFNGKKILICKKSKVKDDFIEVLTPRDLIYLVKKSK
jgi:uncharacterized protein